MVWLKIPVLVTTNIARNVLRSPSRHSVLLPQTRLEIYGLSVENLRFWSPQMWLEMFWGLLLNPWVCHHGRGWWWPKFPWKILFLGSHKPSCKCLEVSLQTPGFGRLGMGQLFIGATIFNNLWQQTSSLFILLQHIIMGSRKKAVGAVATLHSQNCLVSCLFIHKETHLPNLCWSLDRGGISENFEFVSRSSLDWK